MIPDPGVMEQLHQKNVYNDNPFFAWISESFKEVEKIGNSKLLHEVRVKKKKKKKKKKASN